MKYAITLVHFNMAGQYSVHYTSARILRKNVEVLLQVTTNHPVAGSATTH
jgi:hypothetical protein